MSVFPSLIASQLHLNFSRYFFILGASLNIRLLDRINQKTTHQNAARRLQGYNVLRAREHQILAKLYSVLVLDYPFFFHEKHRVEFILLEVTFLISYKYSARSI